MDPADKHPENLPDIPVHKILPTPESDGETAAALGHTSLQYAARYTRRSDAERDEMIEDMFTS